MARIPFPGARPLQGHATHVHNHSKQFCISGYPTLTLQARLPLFKFAPNKFVELPREFESTKNNVIKKRPN